MSMVLFHFQGRMHWSSNQGLDVGVILTTVSNNSKNFCFPLVRLWTHGLEILVPKREMLSPGDVTVVQLNWRLRLSLTVLGLCCEG